jgi:hypothetical protein
MTSITDIEQMNNMETKQLCFRALAFQNALSLELSEVVLKQK